ncbi:hypothetical protein ACFCZY_32740 [Streptomyces sp. NPDC056237]
MVSEHLACLRECGPVDSRPVTGGRCPFSPGPRC